MFVYLDQVVWSDERDKVTPLNKCLVNSLLNIEDLLLLQLLNSI